MYMENKCKITMHIELIFCAWICIYTAIEIIRTKREKVVVMI